MVCTASLPLFCVSTDASLGSGLESGMLFAVPIPEEFAASGETIELAIQEAVELARYGGKQ